MKLFIFGSTGDLVKRKVMRALQNVHGSLGEDFNIYAVGRRDLDRKDYQNFICSDWCDVGFRERIHYLRVDFEDLNFKGFERNLSKDETSYFYLSLPPSEYKRVLKFLERIYLNDYEIKVLLEKPFGSSLQCALDLKNFIDNSDLKNKIFISDHYLFKENFSDLPKNFNRVKIVSLESLGLENRVSYYDDVGALKDMVQSHFLSLLGKNLDFDLDKSKLEILDFVRGQYEGYSDELGKKSDTETFVYLRFRCSGKVFEFITGKGFSEKEGYMEVDGKKFDMGEDNSYVEIFRRFLGSEIDGSLMDVFPTVEDSVRNWEITEMFENFGEEKELIIYGRGSELGDVLVQKNS